VTPATALPPPTTPPKAASNGRIRGEAWHMLGRCLDSLSPLTTAGGIGLLYKLTCTTQVKQGQ
jgi:hypothetical protein